MTCEERKELIANLRADAVLQSGAFADEIYAAADEIERLSHALAEARKLLGENFERME